MANEKPNAVTKSATARMKAARDSNLDTLTCELCWAAVLGSKTWPSFLTTPMTKDQKFAFLLCIDSPAGRLSYKVTAEEAGAMLGHLDKRPNDKVPCSKADRMSRLIYLATEGY